MTYAGVELGGTKCVLLLADGPDEVIERKIVPTTNSPDTLGQIRETLLQWHEANQLRGIGIASFGPIELDPLSPAYGRIRSPKPGWENVNLIDALNECLVAPTVLDTDVNGAALAEMRWGAGRDMKDFAYITVGTGIGVGLIVAGKSVRGFSHTELGHIRVARLPNDDWPGSCPFHGDCVEGLASGSMLRSRFGDGVEALKPDDSAWDGVIWSLAQLCHTIVCAAAPHRIVIGGGVMAAQPHLLPRIEQGLRESLNGYLDLPGAAPYVRPPDLGGDAGPLGAIALAMNASSARRSASSH